MSDCVARNVPSRGPGGKMRLAIAIKLAPMKLGSFEDWIIAMCELARARDHEVDVYGLPPIHPVFKARLDQLGVGWDTAAALESSKLAGVRRLQSYDVIHLNMFGSRDPLPLIARAAYPSRVIFVDHASGPVPGTETAKERLVKLLKRPVDLLTMTRIDLVVGVSRYVTERDKQQFGLRGGRAHTIYNGVDVRRFEPIAESPEQRSLTVTTVAHLIRPKGVEHLVRAVANARNRELRLVVGGDGPEKANLTALAAELGIGDRVHFAGLCDDVPSLLGRTDIFVHPAIWEEAFGLTI